jgi:hypothetical protein
VVLSEARAGVRPYAGDTPLATARAVASGDHRPLGDLRPDVDPALAATVERAMATDPGRRFGSALAMSAALSSGGAAAGAAVVAGDAASPVPNTLLDAPGAPATSVLDRGPSGGTEVAGPPAPMARPRARVPLALLVGLVFLALLVAGLHSRSGPSAGRSPTAASAPSSTAAPTTTTVAPSPTDALAAQLRAAAARLGTSDGTRAPDLASSLRQVADQIQAGGGGPAATAAMISVGAWHLTGQLSDAASTTAVNLLSRVPGVTVVTLPSQPVLPAATAPAPTPAPGKGKDKGKGKD